MDRMERRKVALQALRLAQQEHAHLQARADELGSAYHDVRRKMRDSGEHERRVAEYRQARTEFYAKKNEAHERASQRKKVLRKFSLLYRLLFGLALLVTFVGALYAPAGLASWPIIVGVLFLLGLWLMMGVPLSDRQRALDDAATRAAQQKEPPLTEYRLVKSYPSGDLVTDGEDAALCAYRKAQHVADTAKSAVARAQETYDIACMTPEEETAYWARKRYEIGLEQRDRLARIELEVEMAQGQASEAAAEQKRLLGDQTDELERLTVEIRRLREK